MIKPEELTNIVDNVLSDYLQDIEEGVVNVTNNVTTRATNELKTKSPKGYRGSYAKGWKRQTGARALKNDRYVVKIYNATDYQLTHLLEFGHATADGGRTKEQPHIRPIEKKYSEEYEATITTMLKGGII